MKDLIKMIVPRKTYFLGRFIKDFVKNPLLQKKISVNSTNITIVYLIQFPEGWNSIKSVYYAGKSKNVNSYVLCIPKPTRKKDGISFFEGSVNESYDFCKMNGIECIRADLGGDSWFDIDTLNPDYVIYTRPYMPDLPSLYSCEYLKYKYKLCYIPYAYTMIEGDLFYITFNSYFIRNMYFVFVPNRSRLELCKDEFYWEDKFRYCKFLYLGFPRFDLILNNFNDNEEKHTVLWLPRWSVQERVEGQKESHFLKYYKQFIEYAEQKPNIHLIIRPHPLMFDNFIEKGIMTEDEIKNFKEICRKNSNIELDFSKDYLPTIQKANILVADYTSLLVEFFVTGKPIIYCDDTKGLNKEAILMDRAFYHANNFKQIKEQIEMIFNNQDSLVDMRKEILKEIVPNNMGTIGEEIIETLLNDYNQKK